MEGEHHYELRSRSRSRSETPQVLSKLLTDSDRHASRERSYTPADVSRSRRSSSRSTTASMKKTIDKNMDTIDEQKEETPTKITSEAQKTVEKSTVIIVKKGERRSERQKVKRQIFANGQSESKDKNSKNMSEISEIPTSPTTVTSDYFSDGEKEDLPSKPKSAYEIYKQAGDWWNVFPKTDYTYSEASKCRYEIAPGILAMPNMSRRSLHSNENSTIDSNLSSSQINSSQSSKENIHESMNSMERRASKNEDLISINGVPQLLPHIRSSNLKGQTIFRKEVHIHRQTILTNESMQDKSKYSGFFSWSTPFKRNWTRKFSSETQIDSDAELDDAMAIRRVNRTKVWRNSHWYERFIATITAWFYTVMDVVTLKKFTRKNVYASHDYRLHRESKWSRLWKPIGRFMQYLYLLLVNLLLLDSWLLSRLSPIRDRVPARRFKILWLVLLPPILLTGAYIAHKHTFTCLDYLRNLDYGVTKSTHHVFNDFTNFSYLDYELLAKYLMILQNYSLPSVNVPLPSLPDIGWNITW